MKDERDIQEENLMEDLEDPTQARDTRRALDQLRKNPDVDPRLQQMARELLSGRTGLRDIIENPTYLSALGENLNRIRQAAEQMTPEEEQRSREQAERFFAEQKEEAEREDAEREQQAREERENSPRPKRRH
ncbi:hypothetical protein H3146_21575 [Streptomyces sp. OF3]|uniref:Uncharacterized protein n=1 Tax=Streptomyces alkaliterrae TaxID=2213162 RepID=A0A7W3WP98_9ACTN|nr:hypothetical protein [Streptomyces alkaliterrae]MBB1255929.1 hypothetical protein [Streptomyces alkaliterrae]